MEVSRTTLSFTRIEKNASEDHGRLRKACCEMEAVFLNYLLKSMRNTVQETELFGSRRDEKLFREMLDAEVCSLASRTQSLGIADMLYCELSKSLEAMSRRMDPDGSDPGNIKSNEVSLKTLRNER
ncbi:MAG: rod-binding protein [Armatimonadota bacterium]